MDGHEQCDLDHGHGGHERIGQRHGELFVHREPEWIVTERDDLDRGQHLHGDAGRSNVLVHRLANECLALGGHVDGDPERDEFQRLFVDGVR